MNEMAQKAAKNLAETAEMYNYQKQSGDMNGANLWNQIYGEKAALLKAMGFQVKAESKDGYAVAVTVNGAREEVCDPFN